MSWIFNQANGKLFHDGQEIADGYSGSGPGKNNGAMQNVPDVGPIPRGEYEIGYPFDSESHGPVVMHLNPKDGTDTMGRGGFLIHGDSKLAPGTASKGCVILPRSVRLQIGSSDDRILQVV